MKRIKNKKGELEIGAVMLSWALYGAAITGCKTQKTSSEQYVKHVMPVIKTVWV